MALEWGVTPVSIPEAPDVEELWATSLAAAVGTGIVENGDRSSSLRDRGEHPRVDERDQGRDRVAPWPFPSTRLGRWPCRCRRRSSRITTHERIGGFGYPVKNRQSGFLDSTEVSDDRERSAGRRPNRCPLGAVAVAICLMIGETYVFRRLAGGSRRVVGRGTTPFNGRFSGRRRPGARSLGTVRAGSGSEGMAARPRLPRHLRAARNALASLAATYARADDLDWLASAMAAVAWLSIAAGATDLLIENPAVPSASGRHRATQPPAEDRWAP